MKVLLDENFPLPLLDALVREQIDAEHIIQLGLRGTPDSRIRARFDQESIVLLTQDTEFLMAPMPTVGWVIVSRVRQSRDLDDRVEVWLQTIRNFLSTIPASRILELLDDGGLLPWFDPRSDDSVKSQSLGVDRLELKVLGVDVGSSDWSANGSAVISFTPATRKFQSVVAPAIDWPIGLLTARALGDRIDEYARSNDICAVAIDGPQGWRDPDTPTGLPGVGRRCEYECRTQGKTGVYPHTFPSNQRHWIEFCVTLFDTLLDKKGVRLSEPGAPRGRPADGYLLLECYPTSAWRSSGLRPLPAKSKAPPLDAYANGLARVYELPASTCNVGGHDDLQAVVAAVVAAGVVGGPVAAVSSGIAATTKASNDGVPRRVEGFIWNVRPLATSNINSHAELQFALRPRSTKLTGPAVRVTQKVIDQIARGAINQEQIVLKNLPGGTAKARVIIRVKLDGEEYRLVIGDSHAAWRSQQDATSADSFERLFALLSDTPDLWRPVDFPDHE